MKKINIIISILLFGFFLATRWQILRLVPSFSVAANYYMPYAHAWAAGFLPYLKQPYEYGPYTIPLFYLPLILEKIINRPYYAIYKFILMIFDAGLLIGIYWWLVKQKRNIVGITIPLLFFILAGWAIKDFYFDSYDLVFGGMWLWSVLVAANYHHAWGRLTSYLLFWVTAGLKYINLPLGMIYWLILDKKIQAKKTIPIMVAFALVWLPVVAKFGSTLTSTYRIHAERGLQVESLPANMIRLINSFSHTESFAVNANAVEIIGPLSRQSQPIFMGAFILGLALILIRLGRVAIRSSERNRERLFVGSTLAFLFTFMGLGKILSTPYLIWPIPFLAVYPFRSTAKQITVYLWYLLVVYFSSNPVANIPLGVFDLHTVIGLTRGASLLSLAYYFGYDLSQPGEMKSA